MNDYFTALRAYIKAHPPDCGDGDSVLAMLYGIYNEINLMDDDQIKKDFHELYELMNGTPLREVDKIIYPVCSLCRNHERSGFIHGVQVGMRLAEELKQIEYL